MSLYEITINPVVAGGGDTGVPVSPSFELGFDETEVHVWMGVDSSADPDEAVFVCYALADIPARGTVTRAKLSMAHLSNCQVDGASGKYRVGALQQDGKWNIEKGFVFGTGAFQYRDSTHVPLPTDAYSDTIISGKLIDDAFLGTVPFTTSDHQASTRTEVGDSTYSPDFNLTGTTPLADILNSLKSQGWTHAAFVLDPFEVPASANERVSVWMEDQGAGFGIRLLVEYRLWDSVANLGSDATGSVEAESLSKSSVHSTSQGASASVLQATSSTVAASVWHGGMASQGSIAASLSLEVSS
jgi:hypothetical protein